MSEERILIAAGCLLLGILVGIGAELIVRRVQKLRSCHWMMLALFAASGAYAAALILQRNHISPATHRAFVAYLLGVATVIAARLMGIGVSRYGRRATGSMVSVSVFVSVVEAAVFVVGALVLLDYLGISVAPILTAFGIGGLAVALALQSTLADFFAGIQIAASGQIRPGDFVRVDSGNAGTVVDINWRNTVIDDADGNHIVVPNQKLAAAIFTNYRRPVRAEVPLTVSRADAVQVAALAHDVALSVASTARHDEVDVRFANAPADTIDLVVHIPAGNAPEAVRVRSEFMRALLERTSGLKVTAGSPPRQGGAQGD